MLLNDSVEFDEVSPTKGAELIPMKHWYDIRLSEIWINSELLPNRKVPIELNLEKSIIYRTLERPGPLVDSLSVYSDPYGEVDRSNFSSGEKLLDSLEEVSSYSKQKEYESTNGVDESNYGTLECEYDSLSQEIYQSPENSMADLLEHLCISDSDTEDPVTETNKPLAAALPEETVETFSNLELYSAFETNDNFPPEMGLDCTVKVTGSFAVNSGHNLNSSATSIKPFNSGVEYPTDLDTLSLRTKNDLTVETDDASHEGEATPNLNALHCDDNVEDQRMRVELSTILDKFSNDYELVERDKEDFNSQQDESASGSVSVALERDENISEQLIPLQVLYQRPKEEHISDFACNDKRKSKKEKKLKKKNPRNIPLDNFFLSESEAKYVEPKVDEFYESIMRQKYGSDYIPLRPDNSSPLCPVTSFPSLPSKSEIEFVNKSEIEKAEVKNFKTVTTLLKESACNTAGDDDTEGCGAQFQPNENQVKLVIENIPLGVDEEMLKNIVLNYGEITRLILRRCGVTLKAELTMDLDDPDWIIECLNGSQPFGVSYGEVLKCYLRN